MTGPEHYLAAETLLAQARTAVIEAVKGGDGQRIEQAEQLQQQAALVAIAHGLCALTAATALAPINANPHNGAVREWRDVIVPRREPT